MNRISDAALSSLEQSVRHALETGDESALTVIGYGEITTVLLAETPEGRYACKRLPMFQRRTDAQQVVDMMNEYVTALREAGLDPVDCEARIVEPGDGTCVVYSAQDALPPESIGPAFFESLSNEVALNHAARVFDLIEKAVSPTLAPDGQLSNWSFVGDRILYLDVSTPFMRDEAGNERLNWKLYAGTVPGPIRWYFLREVPKIMDKYHSLRGQILDFIANLHKEDLARLIPDLTELANARFRFDEPLTDATVRAYYKDDAATYELLQRVKRWDRWFRQRLLRQTYPYLLPPKIDRRAK